jgi:hypothetical protein
MEISSHNSNAFQKSHASGPKHLFRGKAIGDKLPMKLGKLALQVKKLEIGSNYSPVILFGIVLRPYITSLDFYFKTPYGFTS